MRTAAEMRHAYRRIRMAVMALPLFTMSRPASMWLDRYLRSNPDDPQKSQLKELLQVLAN